MSERARRWVWLACAGLFVNSPPPAAAQQTEEELVRHLRDLVTRLPDAETAASAAQARRMEISLLATLPAIDTFTVGPLRILTPSDQRETAEAFFREVWEREYAPFVTTSPVLERTAFTFQWSATLGPIPVVGEVRRVEIMRWRPASTVRETIRGGIGTVLAADLPARLGNWARPAIRTPSDARRVFNELATKPSRAARACVHGELDACWSVLQLDLDDTPHDEWYTPEERRALVAEGLRFYRREDRGDFVACLEQGSTEACDAFLLSRGWGLAPLSGKHGHAALLWVALQAGGAGAWDRLLEDPDRGPSEALRYASGLDADELAARWYEWLERSRPPARAVLDPRLLLRLMWIAVFAAFAMRSTRWRLG